MLSTPQKTSYSTRARQTILLMFVGSIAAAFAFELWMRRHGDRELKTRTE